MKSLQELQGQDIALLIFEVDRSRSVEHIVQFISVDKKGGRIYCNGSPEDNFKGFYCLVGFTEAVVSIKTQDDEIVYQNTHVEKTYTSKMGASLPRLAELREQGEWFLE